MYNFMLILTSRAQRKKKYIYWQIDRNSCEALNVEQKEATEELYILDTNASCLPP